ncbi:MAG TPA: 4-hydroxy-tetrahydrodipicolinate reductase, partial [Flavisolibacter sp.]|nr:4-hydroxy-tetrahydrodipicolinate reductase [Flavisolibacter sp.]
MKIALIGYGKMGRMIEEIAIGRGHEIILKISSSNQELLTVENLSKADTAIEFTNPESAENNVKQCLKAGVPVVSGSTGWNQQLPAVKAYVKEVSGTFLHSSNFSIGVNIFFAVNTLLAKLMSNQPEYEVSIREIHHTQKKDAPSGTAVTLAEQIMHQVSGKSKWILGKSEDPQFLSIESQRIDPAPGTHHVRYESEIDDIEIIHTAHSRKGFAIGAVLAAEFIQDKSGVFTM